MAQPNVRLVSRNLLDSFYLAMPDNLRPAAAPCYVEAGYNPAHPHAFYAVGILVEVADCLARILNPTLDVTEQHYQLGRAALGGYIRTLPGRQLFIRQPKGASDILQYHLPVISRILPGAVVKIASSSEHELYFWVQGWPLYPELLGGGIVELLNLSGYVAAGYSHKVLAVPNYEWQIWW